MKLTHLAASATPEDVKAVLARDGAVIVDRLASHSLLDRVAAELEPFMERTPLGPDSFSGRQTRRTGGLVARSKASHELIQHPLVLGTVKELLTGSTAFQLHLTQVIAIGPGNPAQPVHRDQWAFDFFPFPKGYEVQCNTIWALTDFTEENGATRVIPGSHLHDDRLEYAESDTIPAEMERGSVLLYTGAVYHGGGANRSSRTRVGINLTYARSWVRQEENQYLTVPQEIARELTDDMLRLIGYARGAYALGYVDDLRDPLEVLRGERRADGFGRLEHAQSQLREKIPVPEALARPS